jgi:hypothetical protein
MQSTYFEAVMAFVGLGSIVIGAFAERLKGLILPESQPIRAERPRRQSQHPMTK